MVQYIAVGRRVARISSWGANSGVWGRSPQSPEANGGLGAKPPAAGGLGANPQAGDFYGQSPQPAKRSAIFTIFQQNNSFLGIFMLKFLL